MSELDRLLADARRAFDAGEDEEAVSLLARRRERCGPDADELALRSEVLMRRGCLEEARALLEGARLLAPEQLEHRRGLARVHLALALDDGAGPRR